MENDLKIKEQEDDQHLPENGEVEAIVEAKTINHTINPPQSAKVDQPKTAPGPKRPKPFNYNAVMPIDEWEKWMNSFRSFLWETKTNLLSDGVKISALLDELGPEGRELLKTFKSIPTSSAAVGASEIQDGAPSDQPAVASNHNGTKVEPKAYDLTKFDDVMSAFTAHFVSKSARNLVYERFKFNTFNWLFGQQLRDYIKVLRRAAVRCDFLEMDSMIRDRLLLQVRDITLLESLLKIKDLTLEKAIEMCQEHEDKDYRHNPAAQRPPPESESAAKRRRKRKRKAVAVTVESAEAAVQSNGEARKDVGFLEGAEVNFNKCQDTAKLRPSKKKRHRWAKAVQNVKQAMQA